MNKMHLLIGLIIGMLLLPFATVATLNSLFGFTLDIWNWKVYLAAMYFNMYFIGIHKSTIKEIASDE